jgi:UDP-galactopyranose mutase
MHPDKNRRILVVGAGFSGATIARELAELGWDVHVIDKRSHVAGNAYDYEHSVGPRVHKYGPHLFHTNNRAVWEYLAKFTHWIPYKHKVKAYWRGQFLTLPVNRATKEAVGEENVLDVFFRPYTKKMWGVSLDELDPSIASRVPIRDDDNEFYFPNDEFQGLPSIGYTRLVQEMLDHPSIYVRINTAFDKSMEAEYFHVFNSMPIDEYYDFEHGELPYRSIKFKILATLAMHKSGYFPGLLNWPEDVATVNYTDDGPYTRITCWDKLPNSPKAEAENYSLFTAEIPCDYRDNDMERYYPVKDRDGKNREVYEKYRAIPNEKVTFIGRTGLYAYLDMHQAVNIALQTAKKFDIANSRYLHD